MLPEHEPNAAVLAIVKQEYTHAPPTTAISSIEISQVQ